MRTKIALVTCCAGFYDRYAALLSHLLEAKPIALLLEAITQTTRAKRTWDRQDTKVQLSFDVPYIIESVQGLVVLIRCSWLFESSFLPCSIKNGQLLQYSHAYQLSFLTNVKTCVCILLRTAERCENGNTMHINDRAIETERKLFIDRYCM